ncbi:phosphodiesterase 6G, cGMP-specific, rod, gamma, paralog b [Rhinoraja longicauda]
MAANPLEIQPNLKAQEMALTLEPPKHLGEMKSATRVTGGPATPRKGPPKFKQRQTRQFKSKPPKKGIQGFGDDIPGMEGLGTDITVICPWEAFSHLELHELAQYGII